MEDLQFNETARCLNAEYVKHKWVPSVSERWPAESTAHVLHSSRPPQRSPSVCCFLSFSAGLAAPRPRASSLSWPVLACQIHTASPQCPNSGWATRHSRWTDHVRWRDLLEDQGRGSLRPRSQLMAVGVCPGQEAALVKLLCALWTHSVVCGEPVA